MFNKLVEHIVKGLSNQPSILPNAFDSAHESVVGIWFYAPATNFLSYSTTAESHSEKAKFPGYTDELLWLRGRLFKKGYTYLLAYTDNGFDAQITDVQLQDLKNQIEAISGLKIDFTIDSQGYEIG